MKAIKEDYYLTANGLYKYITFKYAILEGTVRILYIRSHSDREWCQTNKYNFFPMKSSVLSKEEAFMHILLTEE